MKPAIPLKLIPRTETELENSLNATLAERATVTSGVWLFVYGLLAKNPPFRYVSRKSVKLVGWQRCFHLADPMNRGTSDKPGLTLGLELDGYCEGFAYLIAEDEMKEGLKAVWKQEMLLPFYKPGWVEIEGQQMLAMLTDAESPALWLPLSLTETCHVISRSHGSSGSNFEYLQDVRTAFNDAGIRDDYLETLAEMLGQAPALL